MPYWTTDKEAPRAALAALAAPGPTSPPAGPPAGERRPGRPSASGRRQGPSSQDGPHETQKKNMPNDQKIELRFEKKMRTHWPHCAGMRRNSNMSLNEFVSMTPQKKHFLTSNEILSTLNLSALVFCLKVDIF